MDTLTAERSPRPRPTRPRPVLRLLFTGGAITPVTDTWLEPGSVVIGRKPTARRTLTLRDDPLLSRSHASVHWRGGKLILSDNDSRNGTAVNGLAVQRKALSDGDLIRIADTFLLVRFLTPDAPAPAPIPGLSGASPAVRALQHSITTVGPTASTVILLGESGVGKGCSARALHRLSGRAGPFVSVNCAAIPETLAESTLFGHVRGAFTGAAASEPGLFRAAEGGTLFIDELGELPLSLQPRLLHAIEERAVVPVGTTRPVPVDVRLLAATNTPLLQAVTDRRFRGDLYARLAQLVIEIPPLRERREDVLLLLGESLEGALGRDCPPLEPDLVEALLLSPWPFNVRELKNTAAELAVRGKGLESLSTDLIAWRLSEPEVSTTPDQPLQHDQLVDALRQHQGVISAVARQLGCSRRHLYRLLKRHQLDPDDFREPAP